MQSRRFALWAAGAASLVGAAACASDDDKKMDEAGVQGSAGDTSGDSGNGGNAVAADGGTGPSGDGSVAQNSAIDGGNKPQEGNATMSSPSTVSAPAFACSGPLPLPGDLCVQPDPFEPNSEEAPTAIPVDATCGAVQAKLIEDDEDAFRFMAPKGDPVLVELSYEAPGTGDLDLRTYTATGGSSGADSSSRSQPREDAVTVIDAVAGAFYDIRVSWSKKADCQPYSLRVDPRFCTDSYEDNDERENASALSWSPEQVIEIEATAHSRDQDHYQFTTNKSDPILLTGSYTVTAESGADLRLGVYNATGGNILSDGTSRSGLTETWNRWIKRQPAGSVMRLQVEEEGMDGCVSYQLKLEAAACTDAWEDNDTQETLAMLPLAQDVSATAIDPDFYDIAALAGGGTCTITYTLPAGSAQRLTAKVQTRNGTAVESGTPSGDAELKTIQLSWGSGNAAVLAIEAEEEACQPYTVRCQAQ